MSGQQEELRHKAAALLATCFVVLGGVLACTVIAVAGNEDPVRAVLACGGCFAGIAVMLWLMQPRPAGSRLSVGWSWLRRRAKRKVVYKLTTRKSSNGPATLPLSPPTAESVREIANGINTWVPSQSGRGEHRDKQQS